MTQSHSQSEGAGATSSDLSTPHEEQEAGRSTPLVSVVIPCYNQAHFLGEAIESVLEQTYKNFEIVVVDDGSTDNTSEVASRYPDKVRLIRQDNKGLSGARNTGIRHSEGENLVFLDADDRLLPGALEAGLECFQQQPECAFVFGHFRYIGTDGSFLREPKPLSVEDGHYIQLLRGPYIAVPAMGMYQRFVFETVGLFDSSLNATADYDLYLRIARRWLIRRHGTVVAEYRQHGANMTGDAGKMLRSVLKTLRSQREYAKRDELHWEAYKAGLRNWQSWYGAELIDEVRSRLGEGEWRRASSGAWTLLRYHPRGLALLLRRGRSKNRELQGRTRRTQNFEKRLHRLKGMLEKERQEVRRLREQNQRLASRAHDMERRLREIEDSRSWKLLKRVGRLRETIARK